MLNAKNIGQNVNFNDVFGMLTSSSVTKNSLDPKTLNNFFNTMLNSPSLSNLQDVISSVTQLNKEMGKYAPQIDEVLNTVIALNEATGTIGGAERYMETVGQIRSFFASNEYPAIISALLGQGKISQKTQKSKRNHI